jgi:hypothetical protein
MLTHCCLCHSSRPTRKYLPRKGVDPHYGLTLCDGCAELYDSLSPAKMRESIGTDDQMVLNVYDVFMGRRGIGYITL